MYITNVHNRKLKGDPRMAQPRSFIYIEQAGAGHDHHSPISDVVAGRCTNSAADLATMWKSMHQSGVRGARSTA
jgi:hypothetical protein